MPNFIVNFEGRYYNSLRTHKLIDYSKDEAIRRAKMIGDVHDADSFYIEYMGSGKTVGYWEKRGSRWYKE